MGETPTGSMESDADGVAADPQHGGYLRAVEVVPLDETKKFLVLRVEPG